MFYLYNRYIQLIVIDNRVKNDLLIIFSKILRCPLYLAMTVCSRLGKLIYLFNDNTELLNLGM